ncbi:hypothetical protein [Streptomyces sp. NPDC048639]|uniref:hypothetical protein n=1 Tax=Streptomyces sp. NPDC048639 TaxID=3365581 RepID=UPI003719D740
MTIATMTQLVPLAKELDENKVTPGVLGFIVFALLGGAVWLLMKSMNKQFQKIDFEESPAASVASPAGGSTGKAERGAERPEDSTSGRPADSTSGRPAGSASGRPADPKGD